MDVLSTASVTIHNAQLNTILNPRTWRWQPTDNLLSGHVECWGKTVRESCQHASLTPHSNISRQEWCYGFPVCCMLCVTIYGLLMRTHEASLNSLLLTEPPCCLGCVVLK